MNLIKFFNHSLVKIEVIDPCFILNIMNSNNIIIYNFKRYDEYHYTFITNNKYIAKIKELFLSTIIINKIGILNILKNKVLKFTTIFSIICSLILFNYLNNIIFDIKIKGDSTLLVNEIKKMLIQYDINKYYIKKSNEDLLIIEKEISSKLYDKIEWIEIKNQGSNVIVNFLKRRESFDIVQSQNALYATKEGIIKSFKLEKGVKEAEINQYVNKGDLLVNGTLTDAKGNQYFIGAIGSVYAYTWMNISLNIDKNNLDDTSLYLKMIELANSKIDKELTGDDEYIENFTILKYKIDEINAYMNIHVTLVEDITR